MGNKISFHDFFFMINKNGSGFAICHFNGEEIIISGESVIMFELKNNMNKLSKR